MEYATERLVNTYMETAIRFTEIFDDCVAACMVNPYKVDSLDWYERASIIMQWVRAFESEFSGTSDYEDNFLDLTERYVTNRIKEEFGNNEL